MLTGENGRCALRSTSPERNQSGTEQLGREQRLPGRPRSPPSENYPAQWAVVLCGSSHYPATGLRPLPVPDGRPYRSAGSEHCAGPVQLPAARCRSDRTNEIDIEYAKWGFVNGKPASFTVYPSVAGRPQTSYQFDLALSGTYTTQSFAWRSNNILFSGQHGYQNNNRLDEYASWTFAPANAVDVPQSPMPAMINLWLFNGLAPSNGQEVEIVIHSFQFTPY
ncbi:uncharacterized protein LOC129602800 isoform X2 [Paramacrobiotus metropolitanus]|uniref:uncharacterized protein LOC129602800 isoform X2 n=1 Tax=Paramacrobiotus metropolitanus TaxID=2943436 RepID=UPI00244603AC|nr:uncharacterized protein LOC129602800 isoform X2 [Paramacrobiotus metropolitanus]